MFLDQLFIKQHIGTSKALDVVDRVMPNWLKIHCSGDRWKKFSAHDTMRIDGFPQIDEMDKTNQNLMDRF